MDEVEIINRRTGDITTSKYTDKGWDGIANVKKIRNI